MQHQVFTLTTNEHMLHNEKYKNKWKERKTTNPKPQQQKNAVRTTELIHLATVEKKV